MKESKNVTHKRMASIRSKNSKMELSLRRGLFKLGYRYKIHYKKLPGRPDIVFPAQKLAIFCDSHFWHGYKLRRLVRTKLKINRRYWIQKIEKNVKHDRLITKTLMRNGWIVLRFWEHQITNNLDGCIWKIQKLLKGKK